MEGESAFVSELMAADLWGPDPQGLCSCRGVKERQSGRGCSQRGHGDPAGSGRFCIEFGFFFGKLWRVLKQRSAWSNLGLKTIIRAAVCKRDCKWAMKEAETPGRTHLQ